MTPQSSRREILRDASSPVSKSKLRSDEARKRRLRWRSLHNTFSAHNPDYRTLNLSLSTNSLKLLDVNWKDTGDPYSTFANGCWRYTFAVSTTALALYAPDFADQPAELSPGHTGLFTRFEVRPEIKGDKQTNPHISVSPRRNPNQFRFLNGYNLTKKIKNGEIPFGPIREHMFSLDACPDRFTSSYSHNLWQLEACRMSHKSKPKLALDGLVPPTFSLLTAATSLAEVNTIDTNLYDVAPQPISDWAKTSAPFMKYGLGLLDTIGVVFDIKQIAESLSEFVDQPVDTGSENKLRFYERYPPSEAGLKDGPITGGTLMFDVYVTPNSQEKYTPVDNGDESNAPSIAVELWNRYKRGDPKESTDDLSNPAWKVKFETPAPGSTTSDALSGASLTGLTDMKRSKDIKSDEKPIVAEGPAPTIRDRKITEPEIEAQCSDSDIKPEFGRGKQIIFDATDSVVHRSTTIAPPEWSLWKYRTGCEPGCPDNAACAQRDCVKDDRVCWSKLPDESTSGWRYSTSIDTPGDYRAEVSIEGNRTSYEFRVGHTPVPTIEKPRVDIRKELVDESFIVSGETSYRGEEEVGRFWVVPDSAFCPGDTQQAPRAFRESALGEPGQEYKATVGDSTSITMTEPGVWELYYFAQEGDEDNDGVCEEILEYRDGQPPTEACQWNVASTTIVALGHSSPNEHNLVTDISLNLEYKIDGPGRTRSGTRTTSQIATDPTTSNSQNPTQFSDERVIEMDTFQSIGVDVSHSSAPGPRQILGYNWDLNNDGKYVNLQPLIDRGQESVLQGVLGDNSLKLPLNAARFTESQLTPIRFMIFALNTKAGPKNDVGEDEVEARIGEFVLKVGNPEAKSAAITELAPNSPAVSRYLQATFGSADPPMISEQTMFLTARDSALATDATAFRWKFEAGYLDDGHLDATPSDPGYSNIAWDVATGRPGPVFYDYDFDSQEEYELLVQIVYPDGETAHKRCTVTETGVTCSDA